MRKKAFMEKKDLATDKELACLKNGCLQEKIFANFDKNVQEAVKWVLNYRCGK